MRQDLSVARKVAMQSLWAGSPVRLLVVRTGQGLADTHFRRADGDEEVFAFEQVFELAARMSWEEIEPVVVAVTTRHYQSPLAPLKHYSDAGYEAVRPEIEAYLLAVAAINAHSAGLSTEQMTSLEAVVKPLSLEEVTLATRGDKWLTNMLVSVWEFVTGQATLTSKPWNITLPVADLCNARCIFCTSWIEGKALISPQKLEAFSEVIGSARLIGLVGHGEPLAHPQFDRLCEIISANMDPRASIYTISNGVYLSKWADSIAKINLRSISISLNAATPETHEAVMGLGINAFNQIIDSIRVILSRNTPQDTTLIYITMVVTQQNLHEVADFVRLGNGLGVAGIWLRSLLPQSGLVPGLNYHTLAPNLHPDFVSLRRAAHAAIADSRVPVQAEPQIWDTEILPERVRAEVAQSPPEYVTREKALRDRDLRRRNDGVYDSGRLALRGRPIDASGFSEVKIRRDSVEVKTPSKAWSYALSVPIALPEDMAGQGGRVKLSLAEVRGKIGVGLLDKDKNVWVNRAFFEADGDAELEFPAEAGTMQLIIENGSESGAASSASLSRAFVVAGSGNASWTGGLDLSVGARHNPIDPFDNGENPFLRKPRFECRAVYYNLYVNEMFFRIVPCCFMTEVPGYEEIRFDGSVSFAEAWNSPAMVTLRRRLKEGPLFGACKTCSEKW